MKNIAALLSILLWVSFASAQANQSTTFVSDTDKLLTVHRIGILPVPDNVGGLYSRYVETKLGELLKNSHRFDLTSVKDLDPRQTIDDYEAKPELVKTIGSKNRVDALISIKVYKHQKGLDFTADLFLTADGLLFAQETITDDPHFSTDEVEKQTTDLYSKVFSKLPYKALVLSRQGNRVTLDVGARDGIKENTVVSVEQIISLKRHPKFHFVLGMEKEILGKIKLIKVDNTLSFGVILQEKERGVIDKDSKVMGLDYVSYEDPSAPATLQPTQSNGLTKDPISFGKHPKEWLPPKQPSMGKIGLALGLGSFHNAMTIVRGSTGNQASFSADDAIYPQLALTGELWITPDWFVGATIDQGVLSMANPDRTSSPSSLSANNSRYDFKGGYKFLLQDDFYGPQINLHMGIGKYSSFIDASTPLTFTSVSYSGLYVGIGGSVPVTTDRSIYLDVTLDRYLAPGFIETPVSSGGSSDSSITQFNFGGSYKLTNQFWITGHLDFEFYSTTFSGVGTRANGDYGLNTSQSLVTLFSGMEYMF